MKSISACGGTKSWLGPAGFGWSCGDSFGRHGSTQISPKAGKGHASRANDTLANERTYLAYVRTALAFIAFGFVIARFSLFAREFARWSTAQRRAPGRIDRLRNRDGTLRHLTSRLLGAWRYAVTDRGLREKIASSRCRASRAT